MLAGPAPLGAQDSTPAAPQPSRPGAEFKVPLASFLVPGMGQYLRGAPRLGAAFTGVAAVGYAFYFTGDQAALTAGDLPRDAAGQRAFIGAQTAQTSGALSAYDAFHASLPALQREGKYAFVTTHDRTGSLLLAPFDIRMLGRWTTWIDLAYTSVITVILVQTNTEPGRQYVPFRTRDGVFVGALPYNAGVGEEAVFRGWVYPVLHQHTGRRAWLSNGLQAAAFGGLHVPQAKGFAAVIAGWAFYEGWLTRRNGWSIRESVFHHFWYDVAIGTATFLTQEQASVTIRFPTVRF
jgi:hypothetical protein